MIHRCNECGLAMDRDHNTALDILKKGLVIFVINLLQELRGTCRNLTASMKPKEATGLVR